VGHLVPALLREMPLLLKWRDDLRKDGVDVDILFLSLDEDASAYDNFLAQHKDSPRPRSRAWLPSTTTNSGPRPS
jgi:hypothetical protein